MTHPVAKAEMPEAIARCFPVLRELRPHLGAAEFVERVQHQRTQGYTLAFIESDGAVRCVAGYRIWECLAWGRVLYVDDLVTRADGQAQGLGSAMFDWLRQQAQAAGCDELHLDSGVQRFGAHRFYLHKQMDISCHHFSLKLKDVARHSGQATGPAHSAPRQAPPPRRHFD